MLEFSLKVKCQHISKRPKDAEREEDPRKLYLHSQGGWVGGWVARCLALKTRSLLYICSFDK